MSGHVNTVVWIVAIRALAFLVLLRLAAWGLSLFSEVGNPPRSVRVVGYLEFGFGIVLLLPSSIMVMARPVAALGWESMLVWGVLFALGLTWDVVAVKLLNGVSWARWMCLVLAVPRVLILIGLPFSFRDELLFCVRGIAMVGIPISLVSLYVLSRNGSAKSFFNGGN